MKNFGGAWEGTEKIGGEILGGALREDSLGLCLICFEVNVSVNSKCMIKIFRGGGVVDRVGGSSERCLKWGGGGH